MYIIYNNNEGKILRDFLNMNAKTNMGHKICALSSDLLVFISRQGKYGYRKC